MTRLAAMLRAVNVGGRKLLMADLIRIAGELGLEAPATLLTSGNLLFRTPASPGDVASQLEAQILADLGLTTDVFVRDGAALAAVVAANPYPEHARSRPGSLAVMFLKGEADGQISELASACRLGETVQAGPGCLYVWFPAGIGVSKLTTALIERRLGVRGTARNWKTLAKLVDRLAPDVRA